MGHGIYVHQQFSPNQLVKGDTFSDADYGPMIWNGTRWVHQKSQKPTRLILNGRYGFIHIPSDKTSQYKQQ
jgi:hypothetical protein